MSLYIITCVKMLVSPNDLPILKLHFLFFLCTYILTCVKLKRILTKLHFNYKFLSVERKINVGLDYLFYYCPQHKNKNNME